MEKEKLYKKISQEILENIGGPQNIQGAAHCATRLRIVLKDLSLVKTDKLENIDLIKGCFIAGSQLQLILGAGTVNEVYKVFAKEAKLENMSLSDVKDIAAKKENPLQKVIKALSDVFVEIIPAILAAAILLGVTGFLANFEAIKTNQTLYAINRLAFLASVGIFAVLPMVVVYSATKRFGGRAILGIVVGAIMLDGSLANAYSIGTLGFNPEILDLFGLKIQMVGFQGGIIVALMMGYIVATLDKFFEKKIPSVIKLLVSPMLTVFISTILLFTIIGPLGRELSNYITGGLVYISTEFGMIGYMIFAGLQQIIVITGLHHILNAAEAQLIATTGRNFLNPLMSVALISQGGAVLGYYLLHRKDKKVAEIALPSFVSILFGISEPAIFGVNLKYKFPLIAGCIAGAIAGAFVYIFKLTSLGFGATAIPGLSIIDPANNGYINYIIVHLIGIVAGIVLCYFMGSMKSKKIIEEKIEEVKQEIKEEITLITPMRGEVKDISESSDETFASKVMGDGILVNPIEEIVVAPADAKVELVFPTKHAIGLALKDGSQILIHCGINTVSMNGDGFETYVEEGQEVKQGDKLLKMDLKKVQEAGHSTQTLIIVNELAEGRKVIVDAKSKTPIIVKKV
ncbi:MULTISPECIES: PTS transporter subunit IIBCA [Fusobacterium]|uniref:PTS beta-glucoside transporter subunit IIBCA n=1 Tax=Fusobacterium TaxID=848 RepID=UPI00044A8CCC|nr:MULTISPECIES: PTS transporter subunit IIBCA [Fusobacterium]EUB31906.1 putative PTS system, sucrose-specific, EIIBCA component [Fusobacterium sp. OBRC1]WRL73580.1 glucose PTS transporter subunit IIA [Fusobacterium polymorphum]